MCHVTKPTVEARGVARRLNDTIRRPIHGVAHNRRTPKIHRGIPCKCHLDERAADALRSATTVVTTYTHNRR